MDDFLMYVQADELSWDSMDDYDIIDWKEEFDESAVSFSY